LRQYAPNIGNEVLDRLAGAFQSLRNLSDDGKLKYPYSTRELVNIVRHLNRFPNDGISNVILNVLDFDAYDDASRALVIKSLESNGIPVNILFKLKPPRVHVAKLHKVEDTWKYTAKLEIIVTSQKAPQIKQETLLPRGTWVFNWKLVDSPDQWRYLRSEEFSEVVSELSLPIKGKLVQLTLFENSPLFLCKQPVSLYRFKEGKMYEMSLFEYFATESPDYTLKFKQYHDTMFIYHSHIGSFVVVDLKQSNIQVYSIGDFVQSRDVIWGKDPVATILLDGACITLDFVNRVKTVLKLYNSGVNEWPDGIFLSSYEILDLKSNMISTVKSSITLPNLRIYNINSDFSFVTIGLHIYLYEHQSSSLFTFLNLEEPSISIHVGLYNYIELIIVQRNSIRVYAINTLESFQLNRNCYYTYKIIQLDNIRVVDSYKNKDILIIAEETGHLVMIEVSSTKLNESLEEWRMLKGRAEQRLEIRGVTVEGNANVGSGGGPGEGSGSGPGGGRGKGGKNRTSGKAPTNEEASTSKRTPEVEGNY
jgi:hypothetical protein